MSMSMSGRLRGRSKAVLLAALLAAGAGAYLWFAGGPPAAVAVLPAGVIVAVAW